MIFPPIEIPENGWKRIGASLWVRPPGCVATRVCLMVRAVREDERGPTVQGTIFAGGKRWVLFNGRFAEVPAAAGSPQPERR